MGHEPSTKFIRDRAVPPDVPPKPLFMLELHTTVASTGSAINPGHKAVHQCSFPGAAELEGGFDTIGARKVLEVLVDIPVIRGLHPECAVDRFSSSNGSFPGEEVI
jgi:hypothetical protein